MWSTDKDGIIAALLSAEITARTGTDPGEIYAQLTRENGESEYERIDAPANAEQRDRLGKLSPKDITVSDLAGEKDYADSYQRRAGGWQSDRRRKGDSGKRVVCGAAFGYRRRLQDLRRELPRPRSFAANSERSADHCRGGFGHGDRMSNSQYTNLASEARSDDPLVRLALDLHWAWNHSTDKLWRRLDAELWDLTHNPWVVLQTVSKQELDTALADPEFQRMIDELMENARAGWEKPRWFDTTHPSSALKTVAYFSMEYMLSEALPIYSGGLGNVAGDQLKAANDLGVPVVAVGLLYQQGYFRQALDPSGNQIALYPYNDPGQLPIKPLRDPSGDWLRLRIGLPGFPLWLRCWKVQVGLSKLYLLDSNDPANLPKYRGYTSELYGGGPELRLRQEQILGIGGWRLLRALNIRPDVCHLNEGHAAFAVLERAREFMEETGQPFPAALAVTRAGNLFTTHTPVEAGFDRFSVDLMRPYFTAYAEDKLHISFDDLMALGRRNRNDEGEPFNMAYLAIRASGAINGVSRLHGEVSRRLFPTTFSAMAGRRRASGPCDKRGARRNLGFYRGGSFMDGALRLGVLARRFEGYRARHP